MRWQRGRRSDNIEDQRGRGGRRGVGNSLSLGAIAIIVALGLMMGHDPMTILSNVLNQGLQSASTSSYQTTQAPAANDPQSEFVRSILGDTEDTWRAIFKTAGQPYQDPKLVLFDGSVHSACGSASSAMGPFYCPADQRVYLDLSFFREMETRFAAAGDFAQAYVIAHEVGHHVQTLLGINQQVHAARRSGQRLEGYNGLLVRQELQADCLAGVWAYHGQQRHQWLEPGDIEEALKAANAIGDDRLQQQSQGVVVPDSFTHGTSAQRERWFKKGFATGQANDCDTFNAKQL